MKIRFGIGALALLVLGVVGDSGWWKTMSLYQIYPRSFKDSDGDGIGDIKGIISKLQHLVDSRIDAFWLSPIYPSPMVDFGYDVSDFKSIDPIFGTMEDFELLLEESHRLGLKLIMDLVPNHSSDRHDWFRKSAKKIEPYTDYYIWHEGRVVDGVRRPPNNWVSVFRGSAWTWNEERQAYYFHQFAAGQPDLNFRNERVIEEMKNVMRFWLDKGVDGFRIDAVPHLMEAEHLRDEPVTGTDPESFDYTEHIYTKGLPETYDRVAEWRAVLDEYGSGREEDGRDERMMMIEAYDTIPLTMKYYEYGAHFPFNFGLIGDVAASPTAEDFMHIVGNWSNALPDNATSNWTPGNHDKPRLATRYGRDFSKAVTTMVQLLPGVAVTYNGDEIGMEDTWLSWEETRDPQGCNAGPEHYEAASRDPARTPFQWDDTTAAGFSSNPKTWLRVNDNYKEVNLEAEKAADWSHYKLFLRLGELRKLPAVSNGTLETFLLRDLRNDQTEETIFGFSRNLENESSVYVLLNFDYREATVDLSDFPEAAYVRQLLSTDKNVPSNDEAMESRALRIPARGAAVFIAAASDL
ncbi:hypothetical protein TKK_0016437 [Trichogramma kaykai]|uniref:alpha-glucosidase n=1 Tax=Trichogramma kaykai TaxID=54128 RepID=A0ABD2W6C1_9HYME